jgi:SAM-dependent methyltransferase
MHRGQDYGDFNEVQTELGDAVCSLAPSDLKNKKIPYLSLGSDVGKRTIRFEGSSDFSGAYVVEDVEVDQEKFRRLFYLTSQLVIQSEAKLKTVKTKKGVKEVVDLAHLTCRHHVYMSVATHLACRRKQSSPVTVVGLGGGGLCSFLSKFLPKSKITAVDIDPAMVEVATNWFGLTQGDRLRVVVQDGVEYVNKMAEENGHSDAILFDVDSKDSSIGMSCPPKQFLEESVLDSIVKVIGGSGDQKFVFLYPVFFKFFVGFFILNLVLRDSSLRPSILNTLKNKFETVVSYRLAEDLNEILICGRDKMDSEIVKRSLAEGTNEINNFFKRNQSHCDDVELEEYFNNLKIL